MVRSLVLAMLIDLAAPHAVGESADLAGNAPGERLSVTVVRVTDPALGASDFDQPATGSRFVGVQVKLANIGTVLYEDAPSNGSDLIDVDGQTYNATVLRIADGQSFSAVRISPGDSRLGYLVFEVPAGLAASTFQFTLDSGFGPDTAEWDLGGVLPADPMIVVEQYYGAINAHDYKTAWALGGNHFNATYEDFANGFAGTRFDRLSITGRHADIVEFSLDAEQTDGSYQFYSGTYTVQNGLIVAASVYQR